MQAVSMTFLVTWWSDNARAACWFNVFPFEEQLAIIWLEDLQQISDQVPLPPAMQRMGTPFSTISPPHCLIPLLVVTVHSCSKGQRQQSRDRWGKSQPASQLGPRPTCMTSVLTLQPQIPGWITTALGHEKTQNAKIKCAHESYTRSSEVGPTTTGY